MRDAILSWVRAQGIDPMRVPADGIDIRPNVPTFGSTTVEWYEYVFDVDGRLVLLRPGDVAKLGPYRRVFGSVAPGTVRDGRYITPVTP